MDEAMRKSGRKQDQWALLGLPSFNIDRDLKTAMDQAVESAGLSREQVVDRMNDLAHRHGVSLCSGNAKKLTKDTLDKWLNPGEPSRTIPVRALRILCAVVGDFSPIRLLVDGSGWELMNPEEAKFARYGRAIWQEKQARLGRLGLEKELAG